MNKPAVLRVLAGRVSPEARLFLEIETPHQTPVVRKFVRHIDRVRNLLLAGRISPDDAHALLVDCRWLNEP